MGNVVSLGKARKARARAVQKAEAAENRIRHGRTGAQKAAAKAEAARIEANAEGHRLAAAPDDGTARDAVAASGKDGAPHRRTTGARDRDTDGQDPDAPDGRGT